MKILLTQQYESADLETFEWGNQNGEHALDSSLKPWFLAIINMHYL